jgi:RecA/RadA recombinase
MSLIDKLRKNSKISQTDILSDSKIFHNRQQISTDCPMINVALSGDLEEGFGGGLGVIAGPSKHFKTSFGLKMVKAFQDKYKDGIILFYDSEFGSPLDYWKSFGIDTDRVVYSPIMNIEQLKFDLMSQLPNLTKEDKVFIFIDSVGNLASKKEVEDAIAEKSVADMTRAKAFKSLFRMVTPYFNLYDIPCVVIGHTYKTQDMYPKDVLSGGTGIYYSANYIWIVGRSQDKDGDGLHGFNFNINVEKSRYVIEKSKIPISVSFARGIELYSGLLDVAMELGYVVKPSIGWYSHKGEAKKYREADTFTAEFWDPLLKNDEFKLAIRKKYVLGAASMAAAAVAEEADKDDE